MNKPINLLALRLFVRVAANRSFSQAAAEMNLPPSSVSRHIASLEHALGHHLFTRHTRAVRLTEAGSQYYDAVREALERIDQAGEHLGTDLEPRGRLRISAPPAFAKRHLVPILLRFQQQHPAIELDMLLADTFMDPVEAEIDVSIRIGELSDSRLIARALATQRFALCAAPAYLQRHPAITEPAQLAVHNCMIYQAPRGPQHWHCRQGEQPFQALEVRGDVRSNYAEYLLEAALRGHGLVVFPTWMISQHLGDGELVQLLADWDWALEPQALTIHAVYPGNRQQSRKTQSFLQFLLAEVGSPAYWDCW